MWFLEYYEPRASRRHWDCKTCMHNGLDKSIRNCGGNYPKSSWAQKGHIFGMVSINQCPKTFVTTDIIEFINDFDFFKKITPKVDYKKLSNRFVRLGQLIESSRNLIDSQKAIDRKLINKKDSKT